MNRRDIISNIDGILKRIERLKTLKYIRDGETLSWIESVVGKKNVDHFIDRINHYKDSQIIKQDDTED